MATDVFADAVTTIHKNAKLLDNPGPTELREMARKDEQTTEFGSSSYVTRVRSRSAKFTEVIEGAPTSEQVKLINSVVDYLNGKELIICDASLGKTKQHGINCRSYISPKYARIIYMWVETLFPKIKDKKTQITVVDIPEWPEIKVLLDPKSNIAFLLGSDYFGELKMSHQRLAMYLVKEQGSLGLHAGSKIIRLLENEKPLEKSMLIFGLSGTGKTTLTCHDHFLKSPEGIAIRQDDIVFLLENGLCLGTERNFYGKTDGLEPKNYPAIYPAVTSKTAILENVMVKNTKVDFHDTSLTSNGRAIMHRKDMLNTDEEIDLKTVDLIFFVTRRDTIVPPIARLSKEQAVAFFMLGESIETSAGDPKNAGKSVRVVGTNPFIIGSKAEEGNRFYDMIKHRPIQCFLLNTGSVGQNKKITVKDSVILMREAARDKIVWKKDSDWNYELASHVNGIDISTFDPKKYYSDNEYKTLIQKLKQERNEWLKQFPDLYTKITSSLV